MNVNLREPRYVYVVALFEGLRGRILSWHELREDADSEAARLHQQTGREHEIVARPACAAWARG